MTGESDYLRKNKDQPWMLSGCQVVEGRGQCWSLLLELTVNGEKLNR